jgi:hypothetical protein
MAGANSKPMNATQQPLSSGAGLHKRNTNPVDADIRREEVDQRAEKKRVPSAGKRVPSAKRAGSGKSSSARRREQEIKDTEASKPI